MYHMWYIFEESISDINFGSHELLNILQGLLHCILKQKQGVKLSNTIYDRRKISKNHGYYIS